MEVPLTPLDFARRARKLYPHREAVIDNDRRFTYAEFLDRCVGVQRSQPNSYCLYIDGEVV